MPGYGTGGTVAKVLNVIMRAPGMKPWANRVPAAGRYPSSTCCTAPACCGIRATGPAWRVPGALRTRRCRSFLVPGPGPVQSAA